MRSRMLPKERRSSIARCAVGPAAGRAFEHRRCAGYRGPPHGKIPEKGCFQLYSMGCTLMSAFPLHHPFKNYLSLERHSTNQTTFRESAT